MTQTKPSSGFSGPFVNIYNQLGLAWWVEINTTSPKCTYYFGPFLTSGEAQKALPGYVQDLEAEKAEGIEAAIKRCKPQKVTICKD